MKTLIVLLLLVTASQLSAQNMVGKVEKTNDKFYQDKIGATVEVPYPRDFKVGDVLQVKLGFLNGSQRRYVLVYVDREEAVLEPKDSGGRYTERLYLNLADRKFTYCAIQQWIGYEDQGDEYKFGITTIQGSISL